MRCVIQAGDTLSRIAKKYHLRLADLLNVNPAIVDADQIYSQQVIQLPDNGIATYITQPGDTVSRVAERFGIADREALLVHNAKIRLAERLKIGDLVKVPTFLVRQRLCDRSVFFDKFRRKFGSIRSKKTVSGTQVVAGITFLLDKLVTDPRVVSLRQMAYILATVKHETASTFHPIDEYTGREGPQRFDRLYDPVRASSDYLRKRALAHGNMQEGDGRKYHGRGYVQITWKDNYERMSQIVGQDLVNQPELAKTPAVAYEILVHGMLNGIFTGRALRKYISHEQADYYHARRVVNGMDKARSIAKIAAQFERILNQSLLH